ncbi:glycosyl hydrolase, partial [Actinoplanes sp. ATCC 53533]|uniref:ricin-type beta-trefoil lectin domain protein n=1 Tax=Actinoplanes sp. ATCC 53533 TaxID=1288362 RepID=UPI000F7B3369
ANVTITVGNTAPTVKINNPPNGALFSYGDTVPFSITVTDPEDSSINCAAVKMTYVLGHDNHGHQITSQNGCTGTITIPVDGEHDSAANIFAVFDAEYTDAGGLTTHTQHTLQPRRRQAEHFKTSSGVDKITKSAAEGGQTIGNVNNGDWIAFEPYRLSGATSFTARVSSGGIGGTLQLRTGSPTGTIIGSATAPITGSWDWFTNVTGTLSGAPATTGPLYLTFAGGLGYLFDLDAFTLNSADAHIGPIVGLANKCLDVAGAGTDDGTKIQLHTCNSTAAQTWTVTAGSTVKALGKCLDVAGGATANGTKAQLWTCNGSAAQNWAAHADGSLRNPQSGRCLDVKENNPADGQQIHIWDCVGAANQKWVLP